MMRVSGLPILIGSVSEKCDREGIEWMAVPFWAAPLQMRRTLIHQQYQDVHDAFSQRPYDAKAYITIGQQLPDRSLDPADHAALMWVANMLYNLDEP